MAYKIRNAAINDIPRISELSGQLGYPSSVPDTQKRVESLLASGNHAIFVAEHSENQIIAWIHAYTRQSLTSDELAEIGGLIVSKEFRGKGIGKQLLSAVETWALGKKSVQTARPQPDPKGRRPAVLLKQGICRNQETGRI